MGGVREPVTWTVVGHHDGQVQVVRISADSPHEAIATVEGLVAVDPDDRGFTVIGAIPFATPLSSSMP